MPEQWLADMLVGVRKRLMFGQADETIAMHASRLELEMKQLDEEASQISQPASI